MRNKSMQREEEDALSSHRAEAKGLTRANADGLELAFAI